MEAVALYWEWVSISSGNGLVSSGNKALLEPKLTKFCGVTRPHLVNSTESSYKRTAHNFGSVM